MTTNEQTQKTAEQIRDSLEKWLLEIGQLRHDLEKVTEGAPKNVRLEADVGLGIVADEMWTQGLLMFLRPHLERDPVACVRALRWIQAGTSYSDLVQNIRLRMFGAEHELHKDDPGDDYAHCPTDEECHEALGHPDEQCECGMCDECTGG